MPSRLKSLNISIADPLILARGSVERYASRSMISYINDKSITGQIIPPWNTDHILTLWCVQQYIYICWFITLLALVLLFTSNLHMIVVVRITHGTQQTVYTIPHCRDHYAHVCLPILCLLLYLGYCIVHMIFSINTVVSLCSLDRSTYYCLSDVQYNLLSHLYPHIHLVSYVISSFVLTCCSTHTSSWIASRPTDASFLKIK